MVRVQEIADVDVRLRVMQLRVDTAQHAADRAAWQYLQQVDRANRLAADLVRARAANAELLARIDALQGHGPRLLLTW